MNKWVYYSVIFFCTFAHLRSQITLPTQPIKEALFLQNTTITNVTLRECPFRPINDPRTCPDPDIKFILYNEKGRQVVDVSQSDWLRQSIWDSSKDDVFLVHGYAGGDDTLPIVVLRDAYIKNGSYNVWMVDWGPLAVPPCYRAAVHNTRVVGRCTGQLLTKLRDAGLRDDRTTCVGHSLGAHICGSISKYIFFRLHRIVALDPARPLVTAAVRLTSGAASAVHVLHTNAGHYGEGGRAGHVDFCINGGKIQPFCENSGIDLHLCSHVWAVCYMAESLHTELARRADPCTRRCPQGPRPGHRVGIPVFMGQFTPLTASGSYCVSGDTPPYCPSAPGEIGDKRCCINPNAKPTSTTPMNSL